MRFNTNIDWVLLASYFAGECSPEERAVIVSRVAHDAQFAAAFAQAEKAWLATGKPTVGVDKLQAWVAIDEKILVQNHTHQSLRLIRRDRAAAVRLASKKKRSVTSHWALVAAFFVVAMTSLYLWYDFDAKETTLPEVAVFKTTSGQRATITLPDGSEALLNAESQIQILTGRTDSTRVIALEGEAFFSVVSDPSRPFYVRAGEAEVRVVGTSFNVSAYPEQDDVKVLVTEGHVQLRKHGNAHDVLSLLQHDLGVLPAEGELSRTRVIDVEKMLAWKHGAMVFEHASFDEVARTLERWFGLEIHLADPDIANRHLSTSFEEPTPNQVISIIASTLSLDYTIEENTVTFFAPVRP